MERFEYVASLGEGAYGTVWLCKNRENNTRVAMKRFKDAHTDPEVMRLALREIRLLKASQHENVVQLLEAFRSKSGRVYIVMEYVERTLTQDLRKYNRGFPPLLAKMVLYQLLKATAFLHKSRIIHRDLKPANILLTGDNVVKLCDFGFARTMHPKEVADYTTYVVTRWYRPPEVLVNDEYGPKVDVWACGCLFSEMVTGRPLFPGKTSADQLSLTMRTLGPLPHRQAALMAQDPAYANVRVLPPSERTPLEQRFPRFTPEMMQLLRGCLALDPDQRLSAEEALACPYFADVPDIMAAMATATAAGHDFWACVDEAWRMEQAAAQAMAYAPQRTPSASALLQQQHQAQQQQALQAQYQSRSHSQAPLPENGPLHEGLPRGGQSHGSSLLAQQVAALGNAHQQQQMVAMSMGSMSNGGGRGSTEQPTLVADTPGSTHSRMTAPYAPMAQFLGRLGAQDSGALYSRASMESCSLARVSTGFSECHASVLSGQSSSHFGFMTPTSGWAGPMMGDSHGGAGAGQGQGELIDAGSSNAFIAGAPPSLGGGGMSSLSHGQLGMGSSRMPIGRQASVGQAPGLGGPLSSHLLNASYTHSHHLSTQGSITHSRSRLSTTMSTLPSGTVISQHPASGSTGPLPPITRSVSTTGQLPVHHAHSHPQLQQQATLITTQASSSSQAPPAQGGNHSRPLPSVTAIVHPNQQQQGPSTAGTQSSSSPMSPNVDCEVIAVNAFPADNKASIGSGGAHHRTASNTSTTAGTVAGTTAGDSSIVSSPPASHLQSTQGSNYSQAAAHSTSQEINGSAAAALAASLNLGSNSRPGTSGGSRASGSAAVPSLPSLATQPSAGAASPLPGLEPGSQSAIMAHASAGMSRAASAGPAPANGVHPGQLQHTQAAAAHGSSSSKTKKGGFLSSIGSKLEALFSSSSAHTSGSTTQHHREGSARGVSSGTSTLTTHNSQGVLPPLGDVAAERHPSQAVLHHHHSGSVPGMGPHADLAVSSPAGWSATPSSLPSHIMPAVGQFSSPTVETGPAMSLVSSTHTRSLSSRQLQAVGGGDRAGR